jgi:hypothetical protein
MNKNIRTWRRIINIALVVALFVFSTQTALAQETMEVVSAINTVWVLFAAFLILKRTIGLRVSPEVELAKGVKQSGHTNSCSKWRLDFAKMLMKTKLISNNDWSSPALRRRFP